MAYAKKYYGRFASNDGFFYQAWVLEEDYGGAATEVVMDATPVVISWGKQGADVYTPIVASDATFTFRQQAPTDMSELVGARTGRFLVQLVRGTSHASIEGGGGTLYWQGVVKADANEDDLMNRPATVDVYAVDGLGLLQDLYYTTTADVEGETVEVAFTGLEKLRTILQRALGRTAFTLPFTEATNWTTGGTNVLDLSVDQIVFYDQKSGEAAKCYEVVREIAQRFGAQVFQWEGRWHYVQRHLMASGGATARDYDAAGASSGSHALGTGVSINVPSLAADPTASKAKLSSKGSFREAYSLTRVVYEHGPIPSLIRAGDFERAKEPGNTWTREGYVKPTVDPDDFWTYHGDAFLVFSPGGMGYRYEKRGPDLIKVPLQRMEEDSWLRVAATHVATNDPFAARAAVAASGNYGQQVGLVVKTGQIISFSGTTMPFWSGVSDLNIDKPFPAFFSLTIQGTSYHLEVDDVLGTAAWVAGGEPVQFVVQPGEFVLSRGISMDTPHDFSYITEPIPDGVSGAIVVRLYGSADATGQNTCGGADWDDVNITLADIEGSILVRRTTEVKQELLAPAREEVKLNIGTGPIETSPGALYAGGSALDADAPFQSSSGTLPLDTLLAMTWLRAQMDPLRRLQDEYIGVGLSMTQPATLLGQSFYPTSLEKDVYHNRDSGEFVRVVELATASIATRAGAEDGGEGFSKRDVRKGVLGWIEPEIPEPEPGEGGGATTGTISGQITGGCYETSTFLADFAPTEQTLTVPLDSALSVDMDTPGERLRFTTGHVGASPAPATTSRVSAYAAATVTVDWDQPVGAAVDVHGQVTRWRWEDAGCNDCWHVNDWYDVSGVLACAPFASFDTPLLSGSLDVPQPFQYFRSHRHGGAYYVAWGGHGRDNFAPRIWRYNYPVGTASGNAFTELTAWPYVTAGNPGRHDRNEGMAFSGGRCYFIWTNPAGAGFDHLVSLTLGGAWTDHGPIPTGLPGEGADFNTRFAVWSHLAAYGTGVILFGGSPGVPMQGRVVYFDGSSWHQIADLDRWNLRQPGIVSANGKTYLFGGFSKPPISGSLGHHRQVRILGAGGTWDAAHVSNSALWFPEARANPIVGYNAETDLFHIVSGLLSSGTPTPLYSQRTTHWTWQEGVGTVTSAGLDSMGFGNGADMVLATETAAPSFFLRFGTGQLSTGPNAAESTTRAYVPATAVGAVNPFTGALATV